MSAEAFAVILERQTVVKVRAALEANQINPANEGQARAWVAEQEAVTHAAVQAEEARHRAQEIEIAQRAAVAAEKSARWAGFAVVVSVVALLLAALPYIR